MKPTAARLPVRTRGGAGHGRHQRQPRRCVPTGPSTVPCPPPCSTAPTRLPMAGCITWWPAWAGSITHAGEMWNYAAGLPHPFRTSRAMACPPFPASRRCGSTTAASASGPSRWSPASTPTAVPARGGPGEALDLAPAELAHRGEGVRHVRGRAQPAHPRPAVPDVPERDAAGQPPAGAQMPRESPHFLVDDTLAGLAAKMNALAGTDDVRPRSCSHGRCLRRQFRRWPQAGQRRADPPHRTRPPLGPRQAAHLQAGPAAATGCRALHRDPDAADHPQEPGRACRPTCTAACSTPAASRCQACTAWVRRPASVAEAPAASARWKAPFCPGAFSRPARRPAPSARAKAFEGDGPRAHRFIPTEIPGDPHVQRRPSPDENAGECRR
jgi:hypothetical protein